MWFGSEFLLMDFMDLVLIIGTKKLFCLQSSGFKVRNFVVVYDGYVHFEFWNSVLKLGCSADSMVGPDSVVLQLWLLLEIRSLRILDTIDVVGIAFGCSLLPGNFKLTLKAAFICPFEVIDTNNLGATNWVAQTLCLCANTFYPQFWTQVIPRVNSVWTLWRCLCILKP